MRFKKIDWFKRLIVWSCLILSILFSFNSVFLLLVKINKKEVMEVISGSMEPTIRTGAIISANKEFNHRDVQKGDIIVFKNPIDGSNTVHRVSYIKR